MANKTINQLDSISTITNADSVPAWDASEEKTGKISINQINSFVGSNISAKIGLIYKTPRWLRFSASNKK